ncbi:LXG domain-containing protein [Weissella confusa]|uniref:T7SS effector LXG polymorphic toxin n=1 Tax=Weissella confusa TaxID=1583 RepID=UPI001C6FB21A|nr:T7SS effector LXG polymorphic toxin [Weissella confusa]QYU58617.1 LXG domain-containing protein [Weissella confusa]
MGRLDVAEILAKKSQTQQQISGVEAAIPTLENRISELVGLASFKGHGAKAMKSYFSHQHLTFLKNTLKFLQEYSDALDQIQTAFVDSVSETSGDATITSGDLLDFKDELNKKRVKGEEAVSEFNSALAGVMSLVPGANKVSDDSFVDAMKDATKSVKETHENYVSWSDSNATMLSEFDTRIVNLHKATQMMATVSNNGIDGYSMNMKGLNKLIKGVDTKPKEADTGVAAYREKMSRTRVKDIEKETGIEKPKGMSDAKYRAMVAQVLATMDKVADTGAFSKAQQVKMQKKFAKDLAAKPASEWGDVTEDFLVGNGAMTRVTADYMFGQGGLYLNKGKYESNIGVDKWGFQKAVQRGDTNYNLTAGAQMVHIETSGEVVADGIGVKGQARYSNAEIEAQGTIADSKGDSWRNSIGASYLNAEVHGDAYYSASEGEKFGVGAIASIVKGNIDNSFSIGGYKIDIGLEGRLGTLGAYGEESVDKTGFSVKVGAGQGLFGEGLSFAVHKEK